MHVIQLRGPWEREVAPERFERFDWDREVADVLVGENITVVRRFGRPTGIEPGDVVRLIVTGLTDVRLRLNDAPLEAGDDVAALLLPRNVLRVAASGATEAPQVRLEIVSPAAP